MPDFKVRTKVLLTRSPLPRAKRASYQVSQVHHVRQVLQEFLDKLYELDGLYELDELRASHVSARLACLIHAASVHPGPGSNPL